MQNEDFRIIIFVSHRSISFEYFLRDGAAKVEPIPYKDCRWPEPMAFYCSNMETMVGRAASSAYHSGTPNAFFGYFEHLPKNLFYTRGGSQKPFAKIFLDAAEEIFTSFFREQLLNNRGGLSDNRNTMPVMIVCEEDVKPNERAHLAKLFRDAGYSKSKVISYKKFVEKYARETLSRQYNSDYVLEVWTEGEDMTLALIDLRNPKDSPTVILENLGRDPRIEFVKDKIWNDMVGANGFLEREREEEAIERAAVEFINGTEIIFDGQIRASDDMLYNYWLNRHEINRTDTEDSAQIKRGVSNFLRQNGLQDREGILLVLRGSTANNSYFETNLTNGFDQIFRSSKNSRENVRELIMKEPIPFVQAGESDIHEPSGRVETQRRKEAPVAEETSRKPESQKKPEPKRPETPTPKPAPPKSPEPPKTPVKPKAPEIPKTPQPPTTPEHENSQEEGLFKKFRKDWRAIKADADGKIRNGMLGGALSNLQDFLKTVENQSMPELVEEIKGKIDSLKKEKPSQPSEPVEVVKPAPSRNWKRDWRLEKANANGKFSTGKTADGIRLLNDFLKKAEKEDCPNEILEEVRNEIKKHQPPPIPPGTPVNPSGVNRGGNRATPPPIPPQMSGGGNTRVKPPKFVSEGEKLIKEGKLKEAREWYRAEGDTEKADVLNELVRSERSVKARKASLETYRKAPNSDQTKKIVAELDQYIAKCMDIGYVPVDVKKLRDEYKKLK